MAWRADDIVNDRPAHDGRVVITGLGFVTSIGNDKAAVIDSLRRLRHGFERVAFYDDPAAPVIVVGTLDGFDCTSPYYFKWRYPEIYQIPRVALRAFSPHGVYAYCAMSQAIADAGLKPEAVSNDGTGLFCASAGSPFILHHNLSELAESRGGKGNPLSIVAAISGTLNFNLAALFGIRGANCGFVSACASSAHALGYAHDEIRLGRQDRMIVVGAEETTVETLMPFYLMRTWSRKLDPDAASCPFDRRRDGFVGTGGGAVLILERADVAQARGARIYAELANWGQASDGHSVAISHPEGRGVQMAMTRAMSAAGLRPGDVDYVNAHATSTVIGDKAEALALKAVFSDNNAFPPISSTKAITGHALSMAGALEGAFCALAIGEGFIPGAAHLASPDPVCDGLNLPTKTVAAAPRVVLSNSSGFGGANVCLVFRKWEGDE